MYRVSNIEAIAFLAYVLFTVQRGRVVGGDDGFGQVVGFTGALLGVFVVEVEAPELGVFQHHGRLGVATLALL